MSAQWFVRDTMNLQCPVALSREGLGTGGSWDMWDLVAFKCVRVVFFLCLLCRARSRELLSG